MIVIPYLWHTVDYINEGNSPVYSCGNNAISGRKIIQYNAVYSFLINQETKDQGPRLVFRLGGDSPDTL